MSTATTEELTPIAVIDKVEAGLSKLEASYTDVPDCETEEGYTEAKELLKPIVKTRTTLDKARLAATKNLRNEVDRINSMCKNDILPRIEAKEKPLQDAIKAVDDRRKAEAEEKARIEQERIAAIEERLARVSSLPATCVTLEQVESALTKLDEVDLSTFDEFEAAATTKIDEARSTLSERKVDLAKQAEEKAELDRQRAEQEAAAAKLKAEQDELERERQEIEKMKAAEQARKDAEAKAEADRIAAAEKAEQDKQDAIEKARREEREAAEAEAKRKADEQAEIERAAEAKRKAEEDARVEAERLAALAPDAEKLRAWFDSIPDMPEMSTREGRNRCDQVNTLLMQMEASINSLEKGKAA